MIRYTIIQCLIFGILWIPQITFSQDPQSDINTDDLGNVSDAFQENFFEALKQKGIENYELALGALERAERAARSNQDELSVIYFERGKNLTHLKRYEEAKQSLLKVLEYKGDKLEVMEALYDLYFEQKDYEAAIPLVQKLIKKDADYKEDLSQLYYKTKRYDKALELMDELDENWGENVYRDSLRRRIYSITGNSGGAIRNLESKIEDNPKNEQDYLNLIFLYSQEGYSDKAFELAQELLQQVPDSKKAHLALYKYYLEQGDTNQALSSLKIIFSTDEIDRGSKFKVLGDYLQFVASHPEHQGTLDALLPELTSGNDGAFYESLGTYFVQRKQLEMALEIFEKGVAQDPDNYSLIKNTILLQIDTKNYQKAADLSESSLAIFPAQPLLYLLNGVSNNALNNYEKAIDSLEMGLDFLLDDPKMEKDFYIQLSEAYSETGKLEKAQEYEQKASNIQISN